MLEEAKLDLLSILISGDHFFRCLHSVCSVELRVRDLLLSLVGLFCWFTTYYSLISSCDSFETCMCLKLGQNIGLFFRCNSHFGFGSKGPL